MDQTLLKYLGFLAYYKSAHPQQGVLAVHGFCWLHPEASRELPLSWRATRGHAGIFIVHEGGPVALQRLACMQDALYNEGSAEAKEAADMMAIAVDGYLRDQDMQQLRVSDVVFSGSTVALLLGRSARGESCKTGRDQGVT